MRAWALTDVYGRLLVALALTVPGPLRADGAEVWPREPIPRSSIWYAPPESDRATGEWLLFDTERLTRGLEPKRMPTIRVRPDGTDAPAGRPR